MHYAECLFLKSFITGDSNDTMIALRRLKTAKDMAMNHLKNLESGFKKSSGKTSGTPDVQVKDETDRINQIVDNRIVNKNFYSKEKTKVNNPLSILKKVEGDCLMMIAVLQVTLNERLKGVIIMIFFSSSFF